MLSSEISACRRRKTELQGQLSDIEAAEKADVRLLTLEAELQDLRTACDSVRKTLDDINEKLAECVDASTVIQVQWLPECTDCV